MDSGKRMFIHIPEILVDFTGYPSTNLAFDIIEANTPEASDEQPKST